MSSPPSTHLRTLHLASDQLAKNRLFEYVLAAFDADDVIVDDYHINNELGRALRNGTRPLVGFSGMTRPNPSTRDGSMVMVCPFQGGARTIRSALTAFNRSFNTSSRPVSPWRDDETGIEVVLHATEDVMKAQRLSREAAAAHPRPARHAVQQ